MRILLTMILLAIAAGCGYGEEPRLETLQGKTILVFTPHPDDDTFCCAGTLALLARRGNNSQMSMPGTAV